MPKTPLPPARPWAARCAALSAAALLALPAAAAPQFGVATLAAVNDPEAGAYTQAGYNAKFDYVVYGVVWDPLAGSTQFASCNPNLVTCVPVAGSSPGGSNPDAPWSTSSARMTVWPGEPFVDTLGTAYARADLAGGTLGTSATGQRRPVSRPVLEGTDGYSAARLWETLNFHVAGAEPGTRTTIQVSYEVDGVFEAGPAGPSMEFWFDFGTSRLFGRSEAGGTTGGAAPGAWINPVIAWTGPGHMLFTAGYELEGEDTELGLLMQLRTIGGLGLADFSHTAALSFQLPTNVSFTSASGAFLTASTGGGGGGTVPEPHVLGLLSAALLAMRWGRRRV